MSPAKVMFSPKELELVTDAGWILTKNRIIGKVYTLFGSLSESYRKVWSAFPELAGDEPGFLSPKISKGEQYKGLPWVMLDHPRYFTITDSFAIRSFFWWGHYCSITLQLSGKYQEKYAEKIRLYFQQHPAMRANWYIGVGNDAWEHHFGNDNYSLLSEQPVADWQQFPFLKLAKKIPLQQWDDVNDFFESSYREILQMLSAE